MRLKLFISLMMLAVAFVASAQQSTLPVTSNEVAQLVKTEKKLVILDVRTPMEFEQGHVKDAKNYNAHDPNVMDMINKLDKKNPYLVYCRTRNRSGMVVKAMEQSGFTKIYQMTDGIVGWTSNGLPLVNH